MGVGNARLAKQRGEIKELERYMQTSRDSLVKPSSWYLSPGGLPRDRPTRLQCWLRPWSRFIISALCLPPAL